MHSLRSIARILLLVLLATVFSPTFGWESAAGAGAHDHSVRLHDVHHEAGTHDSSAHVDHHGYEQAGGDLDNHCCLGHVLGHLSAGLGATLQLPFAPAAQAAVAGSQQRFSSRVPDGLDRPPKAAA